MPKTTKNVFKQLEEPDALHLRLRAELMAEITAWIDRQGLTQQSAAKALGTTQPRISNIRNGRIDKCGIDLLVKLLSATGAHVHFYVKHDQGHCG